MWLGLVVRVKRHGLRVKVRLGLGLGWCYFIYIHRKEQSVLCVLLFSAFLHAAENVIFLCCSQNYCL